MVHYDFTGNCLLFIRKFLWKTGIPKDIPYRVYFFEAVGTLTVFTTFVIYNRNAIFTNFAINFPALLMGLCWGIGTVLFIVALKYAKLSIVAPLSAAYPALTVVLALLFLGEKLEMREILGIGFAIISVVLLAK
jgi:transporter family protein